jgi:hypothetical protein
MLLWLLLYLFLDLPFTWFVGLVFLSSSAFSFLSFLSYYSYCTYSNFYSVYHDPIAQLQRKRVFYDHIDVVAHIACVVVVVMHTMEWVYTAYRCNRQLHRVYMG